MSRLVVAVVMLAAVVTSAPVADSGNLMTVQGALEPRQEHLVLPALGVGDLAEPDLALARSRRSAEACERLSLCKLHARSGNNFFAAFELYFVNKENARLWDHRARSAADCERRYGPCREDE